MRTTMGASATEVKRILRTTAAYPIQRLRARPHCLKTQQMSSLAAHGDEADNQALMEPSTAPIELPLRPQDEVECRRCEVHCDKVVYPGACVGRACPFVYAIEEFGHRYVGCMQ